VPTLFKIFKDNGFTFQLNGVLSHFSNKTPTWYQSHLVSITQQRNVASFTISLLDLSPTDFSVYSML